MKRALTDPPSARLTPQRSRVTARRKMASLRIGSHRRLLRIAMNAGLVSAIIDEKNRRKPDIADGRTKRQEESTGGVN